jgi:hypothetical protein
MVELMPLLNRCRWIPLVFALMFALLHATASAASPPKDQAFEPSPPDTIPTVFREYRWAQTFTVGLTGTLTGVDVLVAQMFRVQPEDLEITIFDTLEGAPHLALTPSVSLPAASVPLVAHPSNFDGYAYLRAGFSLAVTAGDVLAIVVSTGQYSQYMWAGALAGGYPGGQLYSTTGDSWARHRSMDMAFRTFVAPSAPPTANAGNNQTVRPGTTAHLDGSGSYDDNTLTSLLHYAWNFVSLPTGSSVVLNGASTVEPSFVPDLPGNYVTELVVTDQDELSSPPSRVTVGENLAPTANAGRDQLVIVNNPVTLTGSATDPDGDLVTYNWAFTVKPAGSFTQLAEPGSASTTLLPDLPGVYVATLTASDPFGAGPAANVQITAATATTYAEIQLQAAAVQIQDLAAESATNGGNQNALIQLLGNAAVALQSGNATGARQQLQQAISRTDGCALRGAPDGNGPSRDWITACGAQNQLYPSLVAALAAIAP